MAPNTPTIKLPDVLTKGKTSRHTRKTTHPWRERTMKVYDKICSYRTTGPNAKTKRASSANARDGKVNVELETGNPLITTLVTQRVNLGP